MQPSRRRDYVTRRAVPTKSTWNHPAARDGGGGGVRYMFGHILPNAPSYNPSSISMLCHYGQQALSFLTLVLELHTLQAPGVEEPLSPNPLEGAALDLKGHRHWAVMVFLAKGGRLCNRNRSNDE